MAPSHPANGPGPTSDPIGDPPDHIGWLLWRASEAWVDRFVSTMQARGWPEFTLSRSRLLSRLDRKAGTRLGDLAARAGLTKQAAQQLVDELVAANLVERQPDPTDARAKLIAFTRRGLRFLKDADAVKAELEASLASRLGPRDLAHLRRVLALVEF
jgi:DNA-binding MarR family transcriptional regulator